MSDADDQMGGTGGDTGPPPEKVKPGADNAAPTGADEAGDAKGEDASPRGAPRRPAASSPE